MLIFRLKTGGAPVSFYSLKYSDNVYKGMYFKNIQQILEVNAIFAQAITVG